MKLKKVHRVLQFDQECWMEPYNRMNTEFQKQREELLQPHVQFRIWENNGECAEASSQHNCLRR